MIDSNFIEYSKLEPLNVSRETYPELEVFRSFNVSRETFNVSSFEFFIKFESIKLYA